jgi:hypothetical protein
MLPPATSGEGLCWRPWPCRECNSGLTAIGVILRGYETDPPIRGESPEKVAGAQVKFLQAWIAACGHLGERRISLPALAEGSEHKVFLSADDARVYKATRPGIYGESYYLKNNLVHQQNCSPLEYLIRLRLWKKVFRSAPMDLGMTECGRIISVQKYISGDLPSQEAVNEFLFASGFSDVKRQCFLWKKTYDAFEIWLGDARDENFVETPRGIVPIDVRMWFANLGMPAEPKEAV